MMLLRHSLSALALRGATIVLVATCLGATLQQAFASVNFRIYVSADDDFDLYVGNANSATTHIDSPTGGWTTPYFYALTLNVNDYIYIPARDIAAAVWGLGGYTSTDGGATWTPILEGSPRWEVIYYDTLSHGTHPFDPVMDLATLNAAIANANANNLWVAPVAGTAEPGYGLPDFYDPPSNQLPALGSIWTNAPTGDQHAYMRVVFRYKVVPEPASLLALGAGLAGLMGLKRRNRR